MSQVLRKTTTWLETLPHHVVTLKLTVIFLLLHDYSGGDVRAASILITLAGILMLVHEKVLFNRAFWIGMFFVMGVITSYLYSSMDNHKYLIGYWTLACGLSLGTKEVRAILAHNARLLVGLAFGFAVFWKVIGGEFLSGEFFQGIFLLDERFWLFTTWVTGVSVDALESFDDLLMYFEIFPNLASSLTFPASAALSKWALGFSYWTLVIESLIAGAFLLKGDHGFQRYRHVYLMIFLLTTYVLAPVDSFAMILCILGFAHLKDSQIKMKWAYLSLFFLFQLWEFVPDLKEYFLYSL